MHFLRMSVLFGLLFLASGCIRRVHIPTFPHELSLAQVEGAKGVRIVFHGQDQSVIPYVVDSSQKALFRVRMWGALTAPLTIRIFPSHQTLEQAVMRKFHWLRAWALYQEIYLQSPRTWQIRYYKNSLSELLVHELTHVAMYQACCLANNWYRQRIPFWFREGMASVTARQGRRRWSMERLGLFGQTAKGREVLLRPNRHLKRHQAAAYSLAHWMFFALLQKSKKKGIQTLLKNMKQQGLSFAASFKKVTGLSPRAYRMLFLKQLWKVHVVHFDTKRENRTFLSSSPLFLPLASK